MFAAIGKFFAMFYSLFSAGERSAQAIDNIALVAERKSQLFLMQQEAELRDSAKELGFDVELTFSGKSAPAKAKQLAKS